MHADFVAFFFEGAENEQAFPLQPNMEGSKKKGEFSHRGSYLMSGHPTGAAAPLEEEVVQQRVVTKPDDTSHPLCETRVIRKKNNSWNRLIVGFQGL